MVDEVRLFPFFFKAGSDTVLEFLELLKVFDSLILDYILLKPCTL